MILYLVRHAVAERRGRAEIDDERALTAEGIEKMRTAVVGLRTMGVTLDRILTSPLRRACETATILAEGLGKVAIDVLPALAPGGRPAGVLAALRAIARLEAVALVGHAPDIGELAIYLTSGSTTSAPPPLFKKGAAARFGMDVTVRSPRASLDWLLQPRELRRLAMAKRDRWPAG